MEAQCGLLWNLVIIVYTALLQSRENPQQVQAEMMVVPPGSSVLLSCDFPVKANMTPKNLIISWQHREKEVHSYYLQRDQLERQDVGYKSRTHLFHDQLHTGNASLMLKDVQPEHEGEYSCHVTSESGQYKSKLLLLVAAPYDEPQIAIQYSCENVNIMLSSSHGFPEPKVTWFASFGDPVTTLDRDSRGRYTLQSNMSLRLNTTQTVRVEMSLEKLSQSFTEVVTLHPSAGCCERESNRSRVGLSLSLLSVILFLSVSAILLLKRC